MTPELSWIVVGFAGQGLFFARFLVQWMASERAKRSVVPTAFWYFSIIGAAISLVYAIHRRDPVFITSYAFGFFIYVRNLYFIHRRAST
ncbi:MAG: lipid-A-disaccharide synthase N-terminal domain-containing protein [Gammaproteobacteria bacterium]